MTDYYSKEAIKERLQTQDNRITQDPLFVVQEEMTTIGLDTSFRHDGMCFVHMEDEYETIFDTDDEYEEFDKNYWSIEDENWAHKDEEWTTTGYEKEWISVAYFFTEVAADADMGNQLQNMQDQVIDV